MHLSFSFGARSFAALRMTFGRASLACEPRVLGRSLALP
jgi:hypothetical protein